MSTNSLPVRQLGSTWPDQIDIATRAYRQDRVTVSPALPFSSSPPPPVFPTQSPKCSCQARPLLQPDSASVMCSPRLSLTPIVCQACRHACCMARLATRRANLAKRRGKRFKLLNRSRRSRMPLGVRRRTRHGGGQLTMKLLLRDALRELRVMCDRLGMRTGPRRRTCHLIWTEDRNIVGLTPRDADGAQWRR